MMLSSGLTNPIERQLAKASAVKSFPDTLGKGAALPLPDLPLASGAKILGLGHSFMARSGYIFGSANPPALVNRIDIQTGGCFGDLGFLHSMDKRFNLNLWYDKAYSQNLIGDQKGAAGSNAGVGGDDLLGVIARLARLGPMKPDVVVLDIGTNDVNSRTNDDGSSPITLATLAARTEIILNYWRVRGVWVVLLLPTPRTDWIVGDARHDILASYGSYLAGLSTRSGIKVVDDRALIAAALAAGQPILEDGVHMTALGHWIRNSSAGMLLDTLRSMVSDGDFVGYNFANNLSPAGSFLGTSGTKLNGITGNVASNASATRTAGQTETIVASKEVISAGVSEKQVFAITPDGVGTGNNGMTFSVTVPTFAGAGLATGDWLEMLAEVELLSPETIFMGASISIRYRGGLTLPVGGGINRRGAENFMPIPFRNGEKLLLRCLPHKLEGPDTATGVATYIDQFQLSFGWRKEATQPFQIKVSPIVFRKTTDPRVAWNKAA